MTVEQFKLKVFGFVGNEYEVIGEYLGSKKRVKLKHIECGHIWFVFPNNFCEEDGTRCPECNKAKRRKTHEQFVADVKRVWGNEFTIIGKYGKNNRDPVLVKHNKCSEEFEAVPNYLLLGENNCPNCKPNAKLTTEKFKERLFSINGHEIIVLGEYITMDTPILVKHNIKGCNQEWRTAPVNLLHKESSCPSCAGNLPLTHNEFLKRVRKVHDEEYQILSKYKNMATNVMVKHKHCGKIYLVNPNCFINRKNGCKKCKGLEKSHEEFVKDVVMQVNQEYTVIGEYINNKTKLRLRHEECQHDWYVKPNSFLSGGSRCPACKESKGNKAIQNYLTRRKIIFKSECWFEDCRNIRPLKFDFAIFLNKKEKQMNKPSLLIEFQGRHHYEPVKAFGGLIGHLKTKYNDKTKADYCKKNNINLVAIHYSKLKNIEEYLAELLNEYGISHQSKAEEVENMLEDDIKELGYILAGDIDNESAFVTEIQYEER